MGPIEWGTVIVVAVVLVPLKDTISDRIFGSTGPRPNATVRLGQHGPANAPPSGRVFVVDLTRTGDEAGVLAAQVSLANGELPYETLARDP